MLITVQVITQHYYHNMLRLAKAILGLFLSVLAVCMFSGIGIIYVWIKTLVELKTDAIERTFKNAMVLQSHIGNVLMGELFNDLFLKQKIAPYEYGKPNASISSVTGNNILANNMTSWGMTMKPLLDFIFEDNHAENAATIRP